MSESAAVKQRKEGRDPSQGKETRGKCRRRTGRKERATVLLVGCRRKGEAQGGA